VSNCAGDKLKLHAVLFECLFNISVFVTIYVSNRNIKIKYAYFIHPGIVHKVPSWSGYKQ
jgi:hypothetical protein